MSTYRAEIKIMPLPELLDPQGKAVEQSLHNLDYNQIEKVRIGKFITLKVEASSEQEASNLVEATIKKLLINPIIESATFELKQT